MKTHIHILSYVASFFKHFSQLWERNQERLEPPFQRCDTSHGLSFTQRRSIGQTSTAAKHVIRFNKPYGHWQGLLRVVTASSTDNVSQPTMNVPKVASRSALVLGAPWRLIRVTMKLNTEIGPKVTKRTMYTEGNTETRSRNQCCPAKIIKKEEERLSVGLFIQHAPYYIVTCSLSVCLSRCTIFFHINS
jgi:hypothetical protein